MAEGLKILVADDAEIIRSLFVDLLSDQGHKISTAINGQQAIALAKKESFHLAFIDVHMPVVNGVEALKAIKELSPQTTVVMTDSFPDMFLEESKKAGAVACIHKPFNIQEVLEIVKEMEEEKGRGEQNR